MLYSACVVKVLLIAPIAICSTTWQNQQAAYVLTENSNQPDHPSSIIRVFDMHTMASRYRQADNEESDRTGQTRRQGNPSICLSLCGFVMWRLIYLGLATLLSIGEDPWLRKHNAI